MPEPAKEALMYPDCEVCGKAPGRHTHKANGETLQLCTGCMLEAVVD